MSAPTADDNDIPAIDSQGRPIDALACRECAHAALRAQGGCEPGRSCIAGQRLPVPLLDGLSADADWTVRWEAAGRAIGHVLERLMNDDEAEVRERAVARHAELEVAHG